MAADMTPEAAIYKFMNSFGIPAYMDSSVPDGAAFPYITYNLVENDMFQAEANLTVNVWYRTESEAEPNAKVRQMFNAIGLGGVTIPCDGGMIWLKRGTPWAQSVTIEGEDEMVKRRYVNINADFFLT
jgi:hypothetical protein